MPQSHVNTLLLEIRSAISKGTVASWDDLERSPDYCQLADEEKTALKRLAYEDVTGFLSSAAQRRANARASMDQDPGTRLD